MLWRCLALVGDSEEVVCELVSALESALAYRDAFAILDEHAALRARSFLCRYLYAFNAAMTGRLEITREALARARARLARDRERCATTIAAIVERADRVAGACPLDERDLRGWHYVLTGGLLVASVAVRLRRADARPLRVARTTRCRGSRPGIDRLARAASRGSTLPCVYAPPGRDHEIVAHAVAARLGLPLAPWPAIGVPAPGLVVLYDLAELPRDRRSRGCVQRRPDQIVFAHATPVDARLPDRARRDDAALPDARRAVGRVTSSSIPRPASVTQVAADARVDRGRSRPSSRASPGLDADELERRRARAVGARSSRARGRPRRDRVRGCGPAARSRRIASTKRATLGRREEDPGRRGRSGQPDDPDGFPGRQRLRRRSPRRPGPRASSGSSATRPTCCLVDVQLPRKNGFELVREIKSRRPARRRRSC